MTKQEFMAMSLPYGLKCNLMGETTKETEYSDNPIASVFKIEGIEYQSYCNNEIEIQCTDDDYMHQAPLEEVFLLLHPLSDLTKEIEHNGETFVPIIELAKMFSPYKEKAVDYEVITMFTEPTAKLLFDEKRKCRYMYYSLPCPSNIEKFTFDVIQKLIKWHFDIANLIEKGEAIDVNSLNENPYK